MTKLRWTWQVYAVAAAVFLASLGTALWLPVADTFRGIAAIPGAAALVGILVQLWRDSLAHERELERLERENDFTLTVASHMSRVVFDKHVAFCDAYFDRVNAGMAELAGRGPKPETLTFAHELRDIRQRHSPWLTSEIEDNLFPMEHALVRVGASASTLRDLPVGEQRTRLVDEMTRAFMLIIGITEASTAEERRTGANTIRDYLRDASRFPWKIERRNDLASVNCT